MNRLFTGLLLLGSLSWAQAQEMLAPASPHLITNGYAELKAEPDMATLSFGVNTLEKSGTKARQAADARVAAVVNELEKIGIKKQDVEAGNLMVLPHYQYPTGQKPKLIGYRAHREVSVKLYQLERLSQVIDIALKSGLDTVNPIAYGVKDNARYLEQARQQAIEDSKRKATSLAKAYGAVLGKIHSIRYLSQNATPEPLLKMRMAAPAAEGQADSYIPESVRFVDQIEVIYELD